MKKLIIGVLSLMAVIGLAGCANPNEITKEEMKTIKFLNADEIKNLLVGNTIVGNSYKYKKQFEIKFHANGKVSGTVADGKIPFNGKWYLKDSNVRCVEQDDTNKKWCIKIYKGQNKYYEVNSKYIRTADYIIKK